MICGKCEYIAFAARTGNNGGLVLAPVCELYGKYTSEKQECVLSSINDIHSKRICYNCVHFTGFREDGCSCGKNTYFILKNGLEKACSDFERKV